MTTSTTNSNPRTVEGDVSAAHTATVAAGKAITDVTAKVAKSTIDATVGANRTVAAAAAKAITEATSRPVGVESIAPALESAKTQTQDVVGTLTAQTKELGLAWLDAYDGAFAAALELQRTMVGAIRNKTLTDMAHSGVQVAADLNATYSQAVRELLK